MAKVLKSFRLEKDVADYITRMARIHERAEGFMVEIAVIQMAPDELGHIHPSWGLNGDAGDDD